MNDPLDRRAVLASLVSLLAVGSVDPVTHSQHRNEAQSMVANLDSLQVESHPYGEVRKYIDGPASGMKHLLVSRTILKPFLEPHPPHTHEDAEILIVADGNGELSLMAKTSPASAGSFIYAAPNDLHGIRNTGANPLTYYVFRWTPL